ncbi:uncharacterized protein LOC143818343 [Ranitomeya variabilis]|uniref:uncharacterized protein LOC143818343 n=1 Tax=Ranitomeya variabilis TaxID=490064 RepID=UPI004055BE4E
MTEKKLKEAEKSPLTISFNSKEESLLKKKIFSLDLMKKQTADSLTLDQKLLYNHFTLKLRRSELAHARLMGNTELMKHLAHTMFSSFNTTVNDDAEKAVRAILQNGKPSRAVSAPYRLNSSMSENGKICRTDTNRSHNIRELSGRKNYPNFTQRFRSAPTRRQSQSCQGQVTFFERNTFLPKNLAVQAQHLGSSGVKNITVKEVLKSRAEKQKADMKISPNNGNLVRKRPKSTSFLLDNGGIQMQSSSNNKEEVTEEVFLSKVKTFIEKVKCLQQNDPTLKDYYSQRMLDGKRKKEIKSFTWKDDEREDSQWLPTGEELHHRSVTLKKLDTNFTRTEVPTDILFMEQYNLVLSKENYSAIMKGERGQLTSLNPPCSW